MTDPLQRLKAALADRYVVERELGQGGMATVYLAEDLKLNRKVAVKVLRPELAAILGADRFLKEIEVTANLQHPNILPLYDSGEADSFLYYVMPYIEGESLRDKIAREKQLGVEETVEIARAVAAGLSFAHERRVLHRDIKPENILLQAGQPLVADFGIALAVSVAGGTRMTETGLSLGTPHYMSPEQATGDRDIDARSDVYSLGCVVYEMLAGEPPHTGATAQSVIAKLMIERPTRLRTVRDTIPASVDDAVMKALAKVRADRFDSPQAFVDALRAPMGASSSTPTVTPSFPKLLIGLVSAVVIAFGVFAVRKSLPIEAPESIETRIAVAYFENETGDSSLDYLRRMTADQLTQSIGQLSFVDVAPLVPEDEIDPTKPRAERLTLLSARTGASIIVSGAFYREGNTLILQPEVNNISTGKPLKSLQRLTGALSDPSSLLEQFSQRVLSLLGFKFDIPWRTYSDYMGYVPTYSAYKEYREAWDLYMNGQFMEAVERYEEAIELDSMFIHAYLMIGLVFYDGGFEAEADSMVELLNDIRNDFTSNERKLITFLNTMLHNDLTGYLQNSREIADFDSDWQFNAGWGAVRVNRLYEAEEWFSQVDPDKSFATQWDGYWSNYGATLHLLGRHEDELRIVNDRRRRFPESRAAIVGEIIAHTALGDIQKALELRKRIFVSLEGVSPGRGLTIAAMEFVTHGYEEEARESIEEAVQWFSERPPSERKAYRADLFDALYHSVFSLSVEGPLQQTLADEDRDSRIELMQEMIQQLTEEESSNENYLGRLGLLSARLGDHEDASRISQMLGDLDRPYLHGDNILWQAAIAAQLGEFSRAVTLLYDAQSKGNAFGIRFHRDPVWQPLREYPGFEEFMRPKR